MQTTYIHHGLPWLCFEVLILKTDAEFWYKWKFCNSEMPCPQNNACWEMLNKTRWKIETMGLEEAQFTSLLQTAKSSFSDCPIMWPLHYSSYYLGHIPKLDDHVNASVFESKLKHERFLHNISGDWHMSSIRLASWIWGKVQKEMAKRSDVGNMRSWGLTIDLFST